MTYEPLYPHHGEPYHRAMADAKREYDEWNAHHSTEFGKTFLIFGRELEEYDGPAQ